MEKLSNSIATKIKSELNLDNDTKEVVAYGIFAMLQIALSIILVMIFGYMFHVAIEALIVCFAGSILRKYSGGAHANTPSSCSFIGTVVCVGQAVIFSYLIIPVISGAFIILIGIIVLLWCYWLVCKLAPVDSPSKPIKSEEKKLRMRKGSILVINVYLVISIINFAVYYYFRDKRYMLYSLCLYGGAAWQVFTLTKAGHNTVNKMDLFFNQILKTFMRREIK